MIAQSIAMYLGFLRVAGINEQCFARVQYLPWEKAVRKNLREKDLNPSFTKHFMSTVGFVRAHTRKHGKLPEIPFHHT